ncbi:hypothetical protein [Duganella phyllosphaerae]|uniref:Uncharacterized protein n=1 Tax=Duganella phyllosphaerae TaxID=762836 RepID=A0A1E7WUH4_9BURK|nr:hypothetical protein [Duganella phyllosphaerae]OFA03431.1 hypothetical protein DUPY_18130 [Duganella phyllosphaerae]
MISADIELRFFARPDKTVSIDQRHAEIMERMSRVGAPLGLAGIELPVAPSCGDGVIATYGIKFPIKGLRFVGDYKYRGARYIYEDRASYDEHMRFGFKSSNKVIDYREVVNEHFPKVAEAFKGYKANVVYNLYGFYYQGGLNDENPVYNGLREDKNLNIDGRNNIYTLYPAQFWDAELCQRALGYGPDEVISRLQGNCRMAVRLLDGVYVVLNDDPHLSYEDFVQMNEHIKPILGLI